MAKKKSAQVCEVLHSISKLSEYMECTTNHCTCRITITYMWIETENLKYPNFELELDVHCTCTLISTIKFSATSSNNYGRGRNKCPLNVSHTIKLQETTLTFHWSAFYVNDLIKYAMPMRRKRVRLCCHILHDNLCSPLRSNKLRNKKKVENNFFFQKEK